MLLLGCHKEGAATAPSRGVEVDHAADFGFPLGDTDLNGSCGRGVRFLIVVSACSRIRESVVLLYNFAMNLPDIRRTFNSRLLTPGMPLRLLCGGIVGACCSNV